MDNSNYSIKYIKTRIEEPTLLMLNDDCLIKICQFLNLIDCASLANTCDRLRNVAESVRVQNVKKVEVEVRNRLGGRGSTETKTLTHEDFEDILSLFGNQFLSIKIFSGDSSILETIRNKCENLNKIDLSYFYGSIELQKFKNLKELNISHSVMLVNELKSCFESNSDIESFSYNEEVNEDFMKLLHLLPKLKCLELHLNPDQQLQGLLNLNGLTKLSFHSRLNCNKLLIKLAESLNLLELQFCVDIDQNTFGIIQSFRNLEVLSISPNVDCWLSSWYWRYLQENTIFPPKLKQITFYAISMSCSTFLSMVKQLKFLELFDLGCADIFRDFEPDDIGDNSIDDYMIISRIVNQLKSELYQRNLTLIYPDFRIGKVKNHPRNTQPCLFKSDHFKIIRRVFDWEKEQSEKTILKVWSRLNEDSEHECSTYSAFSDSSFSESDDSV